MPVRALNKKTFAWASTEDGTNLHPIEDWIIDPVFVDEDFAKSINSKYWTFDGDRIITPTPAEYEEIKKKEQQDLAWFAIQAERDRRKSAGVKVGDNWFHSDDTSRIQQLALVIFGVNMPPGIMWKTMQGTFVQMTPELALAIFQQSAISDQTIFAVAEIHRQAMLASDNPASYDFSGGWPMSYDDFIKAQN